METKNLIIQDFDIKTEGEDAGVFSGYGSTFGGEPDSYGDIIAEGAFIDSIQKGGRNGNGIAMLWSHDHSRPIGTWTALAEDNIGLAVTGKLAINSTDGKDMFELMKIGAVKGLSIGYNTLEKEVDYENDTQTLKKINLWEISPTVFPANTRATITTVKSMIEEAKNERELEKSLREVGLSKSAAQYLVSLCKDKLFEKKSEDSSMIKIYKGLIDLKEEIKNLNKG